MYVYFPTPRKCQYHLHWQKGVCRYIDIEEIEIRYFWIIWIDLNPKEKKKKLYEKQKRRHRDRWKVKERQRCRLEKCSHLPQGFPHGSDDKDPTCNVGDLGSISGLGRSLEEDRQPIPVFLPRESHGQRSLAGYRPCGRKESDKTEQLGIHSRMPRNTGRHMKLQEAEK